MTATKERNSESCDSAQDSAFHSCNGCTDGSRVAHRPAISVHLRHKFSEYTVEFVGCFKVDRVATVWHDRESRRRNILLHQNSGQKARPVFIAEKNERWNDKAF